MGDGSADEFRYWAFLSYSHKDAAAARALHRRLETYHIPARLAGTRSALGRVPDRLWPIFRDREELPAATDLSETVRQALDQSGALIILCSPDAAQSMWVAEEIRTFRALHPDRPILAAILSGSPPDCFPGELRRVDAQGLSHEPLATDLRPGGDGPQLGLLKLVAGITGLGLDDLVQRDAARRIRRVTAVSVAALIGALMMGALTAMALGARAEADRQRTAAEGQIEFMLTDLRSRLRAVGRTDIMAAVNRHALRYYDGQNLSGLPAESLERRARILHAIGEDEETRGNLPAAAAAFREAHRITEIQLRKSPDEPERIFAHAQSEYWIGSVAERLGNYGPALAAYERYRSGAGRMNELVQNNPRFIGELAYSESNLGSVYLNGLHRPAIARRHFQASLNYFRQARRMQSRNLTWREEIADAHAWIADTWYAERRYEEARAERLVERSLKRALLNEDPTNRAFLYATVISTRSLGRIEMDLGAHDRALPLLIEARSNMTRLLSLDPANLIWRGQATWIEMNLAEAFEASRNHHAAIEALANAQTLLSDSRRRSRVLSENQQQMEERLNTLFTELGVRR